MIGISLIEYDPEKFARPLKCSRANSGENEISVKIKLIRKGNHFRRSIWGLTISINGVLRDKKEFSSKAKAAFEGAEALRDWA